MKKIGMFLPLFIFYLVFTLIFSDSNFVQDEARYYQYATNITNGFYAYKDLSLVNGPGYPLILALFLKLKMSLLFPKLLNSFFLIGGIIYLYNVISHYLTGKKGIIISYVIGLFPIVIINLLLIQSECLAFFLVCAFIYNIIKYFKNETNFNKFLFLASGFFSYLAITRTIFGFVILAALIVLVISYYFLKNIIVKKTIFIIVLSLIFCIPYLIYTFSLTGKIYYWSTNAGDTVYWLTTPYENEFGDWYTERDVMKSSIMNKGHRNFYRKLDTLNAVQKDELFRSEAIKNIYSHPIKFVQNWLANVGRLLFNYPYTYDLNNNTYDRQKVTTYINMLPNMFLFVLFIFSLYPAFISRKIIPPHILIISMIGFIYLIGSSFASAIIKYFVEALPFLVLWLVYIYSQIVKIEIKR